MKLPQSKSSLTALTAACVMGVGLILNPVFASVSPPATDDTLSPGEYVEYEKAVTLPDFPAKLDVCLLVDLSGSYIDDLPNIQVQMDAVWDIVKADIDDVRWCVASFVDYPFAPWGSLGAGDYAYALNEDLTPNKADFTAALASLVTRDGVDFPESQYEALYQMATGAGRDVDPAGPSPGDIPSGLAPAWRDDASRVLIITTDADFHVNGDAGSFPYPGPTAADATDAVIAESIKVVALKAPGASAQMDDLAADTGGSVQPTDSSSSDIGAAIVAAFDGLSFDVTGTPVGCDKLDISLDPDMHFGVAGGETVYFDETIAVPADVTDVDNPYCCDVDFTADDLDVGTQAVCVTVQREVAIDIKPGGSPNSINLQRDTGVIPVAILGSDEFDVSDVVFSTLTFGALGQAPEHDAGHYEDVNGDGYTDLVSHYVIYGTGIISGDIEACISGETDDGIDFMGCDSVRTIH